MQQSGQIPVPSGMTGICNCRMQQISDKTLPYDRFYAGDRSRRWWVLATVAAAQFMFGVDACIVNVAIPTLQPICTPARRRSRRQSPTTCRPIWGDRRGLLFG